MAKKISRALINSRDYVIRPFSLKGHEHPVDYPVSVADETARDAITSDQRVEGMLAYTQDTATTWQLRGGTANANWEVLIQGALTSHTLLLDVGTNTHVAIDAHIADATLHFTQAEISITESQVSDLQSYALATHDHDADYLAIAGTAVLANAIASATTSIDLVSGAAPTVGQVLMATSSTAATWQDPASGLGDIVQVGTMSQNWVAYFSADKNLTGDVGFQWDTNSLTLTSSSGWALEVLGPSTDIRIGTDDVAGGTTRSNVTTKTGLIAGMHYTNAEEAAAGIQIESNATQNILRLGGGSADVNASTSIEGYLAADAVTVTGTKILDITQALFTIGTFVFNIDQALSASEDGYVLSYDNTSGEISLSPAGIVPTGTPLANEIAVFDSATSAGSSSAFTWDGSILTVGDFVLDNALDTLTAPGSATFGDQTDASVGVNVDSILAGTPFFQLMQAGTVKGMLRYYDTADRLELASPTDDIEIRPGNVDTYTLKQATFLAGNYLFNIDETVGASQDGYVLTYDDASGEIGLLASSGGGDAVISQLLLIGA